MTGDCSGINSGLGSTRLLDKRRVTAGEWVCKGKTGALGVEVGFAEEGGFAEVAGLGEEGEVAFAFDFAGSGFLTFAVTLFGMFVAGFGPPLEDVWVEEDFGVGFCVAVFLAAGTTFRDLEGDLEVNLEGGWLEGLEAGDLTGVGFVFLLEP